MTGAFGKRFYNIFPIVAFAVKSHCGDGRLVRLEQNQSAQRIDEIGVDQHMGLSQRRLLLLECRQKFLFRPVLTGDEMILISVDDFVAHETLLLSAFGKCPVPSFGVRPVRTKKFRL